LTHTFEQLSLAVQTFLLTATGANKETDGPTELRIFFLYSLIIGNGGRSTKHFQMVLSYWGRNGTQHNKGE
jgi:hypothetical protein